MDIQAARRDGYTEMEIADELARRTGRDAAGARADGYSNADIVADFSKSLRPQSSSEMSWSDVPAKAWENLGPSAGRAAGDVWNAMTSPVETAKALGNVALGGVQKLIPGEQESEKYADAVGKYFDDRYGSMDGFKKALAYDPVGVMSDFSTVFTGGAGALRGLAKGVSVAGKAADVAGLVARGTDPLTVPSMVVGKVGGSLSGFMPTPERLYQSALKPSTTLDPLERARIIQTGIRERILPTEAGFEKMQGLQGQLGRDVGGIIDARTQLERSGSVPLTIDPEAIVRSAADYSYGRLGASPQANRAISQADNVLADFLDSHGAQNLNTATAQAMKQRAQLEAQKAFGQPHVTPSQEAKKGLSHALRVAVEGTVPEIAPLNQRLGNFSALQPELERALGRTQNWDIMGLAAGLGGGGGLGGAIGFGLGGPVGAAIGAPLGAIVGNIARQPGTKARAAFRMDDIRNLANSNAAQLANTIFGTALSRPTRATAYAGQRTRDSYADLLRSHGISLSIDKK